MMTDKALIAALGIGLLALSSVGATAQTREPGGADEQRVVNATGVVLSSLAERDYDEVYRRFAPSLQSLISPDEAAHIWTGHTERGVDFAALRLVHLTWYRDPDGLPAGLYAATDLRGRTEAFPVICGYIIFQVDTPDPQVIRVELSGIDAATYASMSDAELARRANEIACR